MKTSPPFFSVDCKSVFLEGAGTRYVEERQGSKERDIQETFKLKPALLLYFHLGILSEEVTILSSPHVSAALYLETSFNPL